LAALAAAMDGGYRMAGLPDEYAMDANSIISKAIVGAVMTSAFLGMEDEDGEVLDSSNDLNGAIAERGPGPSDNKAGAVAAKNPNGSEPPQEEPSNFLPKDEKEAKLLAGKLKPFIEKGLEIAIA